MKITVSHPPYNFPVWNDLNYLEIYEGFTEADGKGITPVFANYPENPSSSTNLKHD